MTRQFAASVPAAVIMLVACTTLAAAQENFKPPSIVTHHLDCIGWSRYSFVSEACTSSNVPTIRKLR